MVKMYGKLNFGLVVCWRERWKVKHEFCILFDQIMWVKVCWNWLWPHSRKLIIYDHVLVYYYFALWWIWTKNKSLIYNDLIKNEKYFSILLNKNNLKCNPIINYYILQFILPLLVRDTQWVCVFIFKYKSNHWPIHLLYCSILLLLI